MDEEAMTDALLKAIEDAEENGTQSVFLPVPVAKAVASWVEAQREAEKRDSPTSGQGPLGRQRILMRRGQQVYGDQRHRTG